ncbi:DUF1653 domain-containing protein [Legionella cardiaca]|uniref:DUF1653 domain-containing protein n=1 Tax=Legionella cardiaca TaxID=1071983 RepID=A0ABY8AU29_9GAMM|nr:DUF1653 domain-containing protein [Legionella cardiaca]WED43276.1 DUF1653 domain-containing protein [Legionella cardiaca]
MYRALYHFDQFGDNQLWVRPMKMFFEAVTHHGKIVPRFHE